MKACIKSPGCTRPTNHTGRHTKPIVSDVRSAYPAPIHKGAGSTARGVIDAYFGEHEFIDLALNIGLDRAEQLLQRAREAARSVI
jgi:lysozyme family protein